MTCSGAFATAEDYEKIFSCGSLSADEASEIEDVLDFVAPNLHAVLAQTGQCDCTLSEWGLSYLKKLNVLEGLITGRCRCGQDHTTLEEKQYYQENLKWEYERILSGQIDLCEGTTGKDYPAADIIQQSHTPWNSARIVWNRLMRERL